MAFLYHCIVNLKFRNLSISKKVKKCIKIYLRIQKTSEYSEISVLILPYAKEEIFVFIYARPFVFDFSPCAEKTIVRNRLLCRAPAISR